MNNWHWTSTSKLQWAKERLGELFKNLAAEVDSDEAKLGITGVKQVTGEVRRLRALSSSFRRPVAEDMYYLVLVSQTSSIIDAHLFVSGLGYFAERQQEAGVV